jgi:hypothetical protein
VSDRVILAVKYTPAGAGSEVRKAVGGFLRYVQHRDIHATQSERRPRPEVSGLLKYVAYRDRASSRAELFGPQGTLSSDDRKAFAAFVANALDKSRPQVFCGRDGQPHDRRRAVYRLVISPERANGLDLRSLTTAAVSRLERESSITGLRWIAAIHRNTAHHHVHLVIAGMHLDADGAYHRVDLTKQRLAAMKEGLAHEIQRQRSARTPDRIVLSVTAEAKAASTHLSPLVVPAPGRVIPAPDRTQTGRWQRAPSAHGSLIVLRAVARRYQRRMERELEASYRQSQWEHAASASFAPLSPPSCGALSSGRRASSCLRGWSGSSRRVVMAAAAGLGAAIAAASDALFRRISWPATGSCSASSTAA